MATIKEMLASFGLNPGNQKAEFMTMAKRPRPDFFQITLTNNTNADKPFSLFDRDTLDYGKYAGIVTENTPTAGGGGGLDFEFTTSQPNGIEGLRELVKLQKPFVVGAILQIDSADDVDAFRKGLNYLSADFNTAGDVSLLPQLSKNKPSNDQEQTARALDIKTVFDETNDLVVVVKKNSSITFNFNVVEYLNRNW